MTFTMPKATERPDLWERGIASDSVWPEYNLQTTFSTGGRQLMMRSRNRRTIVM